jgi:hypothetical protein
MKRSLRTTLAVMMLAQPIVVAASDAPSRMGVSQFYSSSVKDGPLAVDSSAVPASPCDDPQYVLLKQKPLDQMSPREYEYFQLKEKECSEYRRLLLEKTAAPKVAEAPPPVAISEKKGMDSGTAVLLGIVGTCAFLLLISAIASAGSN